VPVATPRHLALWTVAKPRLNGFNRADCTAFHGVRLSSRQGDGEFRAVGGAGTLLVASGALMWTYMPKNGTGKGMGGGLRDVTNMSAAAPGPNAQQASTKKATTSGAVPLRVRVPWGHVTRVARQSAAVRGQETAHRPCVVHLRAATTGGQATELKFLGALRCGADRGRGSHALWASPHTLGPACVLTQCVPSCALLPSWFCRHVFIALAHTHTHTHTHTHIHTHTTHTYTHKQVTRQCVLLSPLRGATPRRLRAH